MEWGSRKPSGRLFERQQGETIDLPAIIKGTTPETFCMCRLLEALKEAAKGKLIEDVSLGEPAFLLEQIDKWLCNGHRFPNCGVEEEDDDKRGSKLN